jgi:diguanylate cyclase (GGDEF)-like protein
MLIPSKHPEEERRLAALYALNILDTGSNERFDRITRLAQRVFGTQAAQVNLLDVDRVWFKSSQGFGGTEAPRELSFCTHAILLTEATVVGDARDDARFADNPHVLDDPNVRFYAGQPIAAPGGEPVGTLCIFDDTPRDPARFDEEALRELAGMAEAEIASLSLAIGDELTGLSNRRGFEMLGERLLAARSRLGLPLTVVYADLDNMKAINDRFGHEAGDRALKETAKIIETMLRGSDVIARLGGDEFGAILAGAASADARSAVARIESALAERNATGTEPYDLSLSVGVAEAPPGEEATLGELTAAADAAMYEAKREARAGRDQPGST